VKRRERERRDTDIYWLYVRGLSYSAIGRTYGISARHCRRIVERYRQSAPNPLEGDALERLQDFRATFEALMGELAEAALTARTPSQKARLVDARRCVLRDSAAFEQRLGILPSPGELTLAGGLALLGELRQVLELHDATPEFRRDLLLVFNNWLEREGTPLLSPVSDILQAQKCPTSDEDANEEQKRGGEPLAA
jgi:hypothetical protein